MNPNTVVIESKSDGGWRIQTDRIHTDRQMTFS